MPRAAATKPRKVPTQARAQATVEAILAATKKVLVRDGYEAASTNRVAEVAGVSIGSLYQYFPSKASLLSELIERHMKSMLAVLATTAQEGETSSIEEATRTIIRAVFAAHRVNPKLHRVLVEQMARLGTLEAIESFEAQAQALVEAFLSAHRAELRPKNVKAAARVAVLAVRGVTLWTVLRNAEQLADEEFIAEITDMVTRYLVKGAGG
jgi:AcrR family transcriptional regulator